MNNRKQNKDPKMKIYTGKKVFEPVMMDFIEQLQKSVSIQPLFWWYEI